MMDPPPAAPMSARTIVAHAAREEFARLGVPFPERERLLAEALRPDAAPPSEEPPLAPAREGAKRAHRAVLADCADAAARAIARMLKLRRVPHDQQGDIAHNTVVTALENDLLDDFNTAKVVEPQRDDSPRAASYASDDAARERYRRGIANYLRGVAWRLWSNDVAREQRHAEIRASLPPPAPARAADADDGVVAVIDWLHGNVARVDREVFLRCIVEEQPQADVAADLQLTVKAVETRLRRVRERLKEWLEERPHFALLPLPAFSDGDLESLLRRVAERARRDAEPSDDDVSHIRERIGRGVAVRRPPPPSPRARARSLWRGASIGGVSFAIGLAAGFALRDPVAGPPPPTPSSARTASPPLPVVASSTTLTTAQPVAAAQATVIAAAAAQVSPAAPRTAPRTHDDAPAEGALARENSILGAAQTALTATPPRPAAALAAIEEHARRHPGGQLVELREFLRVRALRALERRDDAAAAEAALRARYPRSPYLAALDRAAQR